MESNPRPKRTIAWEEGEERSKVRRYFRWTRGCIKCVINVSVDGEARKTSKNAEKAKYRVYERSKRTVGITAPPFARFSRSEKRVSLHSETNDSSRAGQSANTSEEYLPRGDTPRVQPSRGSFYREASGGERAGYARTERSIKPRYRLPRLSERRIPNRWANQAKG